MYTYNYSDDIHVKFTKKHCVHVCIHVLNMQYINLPIVLISD